MKKLFVTLLCVILALTLVSCGAELTSDTASGESGAAQVFVPCSAASCGSKAHGELALLFKNAGFTDITEHEGAAVDGIEAGAVCSVSVGGDTDFEFSDGYSSDSPVIITYAAKAETAPSTAAPVTSPPESAAQSEKAGDTVWISASGKKYHKVSSCSGMKNPTEISKEKAESMGYTPCKNCW